MSTSFKKQKAEVSSTALFTKKLPDLSKSVIKEIGILESRSRLEEYISRLVIGICRVYVNKRTKVFRLPKERNELRSYLERNKFKKEIIVDIPPIAICLFADTQRMYTWEKKH